MDFIVENLGKIGFDWKMALFNLINFLILFWILKRFFFKPVLKVVNERDKQIQTSIENIQQAKTELSMAQKKAQDIVDEGKIKANKVIEKGTDEAKMLAEDIKSNAKQEVDLLVKQAKKNIEIDKRAMKQEIQSETATLVVMAVEKILDEKMTSDNDQKFTKSVILDLNK